MNTSIRHRAMILVAAMAITIAASTYIRADTGTCGGASITLPFVDVPSGNVFFCSIAEAYFSALTNGTTPTTYNPGDPVLREQMAAFVTRTMDQSLRRGSRRAALKQFWTSSSDALGFTTVGTGPNLVESDGADLWVANSTSGTVTRVRASDGSDQGTWTGATGAVGVLAAKGLIFVTGSSGPSGKLYQINPALPPGAVTVPTSSLGMNPRQIAFDGKQIWTANDGGSVSIVALNPIGVTTVMTGFTTPFGILYDGANMWVTDDGTFPGKLFKVDSNGAIIQPVTVGDNPKYPVFDGTNIWVPNLNSNTVTVVRASTGAVLATLSGNGLSSPIAAAFDGERILVTNFNGSSVSLWKASDLTPLGSVSMGTSTAPAGACSDGLNFWITLSGTGQLARF